MGNMYSDKRKKKKCEKIQVIDKDVTGKGGKIVIWNSISAL